MGLTSKTLTAEDITEICIDFLKENKGEAILMHIREDTGDRGFDLFSMFYDKCIKGNEEFWYIKNETPVLDDIRGKIVLLRGVYTDRFCFDDTDSGINFKLYPHNDSEDPSAFRFARIKKLSDNSNYSGIYVQDIYKLKTHDKIIAIRNFL